MNYQTFTTQQKWSVIQKVESSSDKSRELLKLGIPRSTYYDWLKTGGQSKKKTPHVIWNKIPEQLEAKIRNYRLSGDPLKHSPARIVEQLEQYDNFIISEYWPVESWHRNLNQDVIYRHGYSTIDDWQKAINDYRYFHNHIKRLRSDPIKRTPHELHLSLDSS